MPRQELEPPQCGCISVTPFFALHSDVKASSVMFATMVVDVTDGFGEPPSHELAGLASGTLLPEHADARHKRPPSAAESSN